MGIEENGFGCRLHEISSEKMSREASGKIKIPGFFIEGSWKSEFKAPLSIPPCTHNIHEEKSFWTKKKKIRIIHGREDGSNSIKWEEKKKNDG